jgi:hypothetical protein
VVVVVVEGVTRRVVVVVDGREVVEARRTVVVTDVEPAWALLELDEHAAHAIAATITDTPIFIARPHLASRRRYPPSITPLKNSTKRCVERLIPQQFWRTICSIQSTPARAPHCPAAAAGRKCTRRYEHSEVWRARNPAASGTPHLVGPSWGDGAIVYRLTAFHLAFRRACIGRKTPFQALRIGAPGLGAQTGGNCGAVMTRRASVHPAAPFELAGPISIRTSSVVQMAIVHQTVRSHGCTFEVWDGDIDDEEVRAHLLRLAEDPDWPPGALNLVDLSTVRTISIPDPALVALLREGTILETELKTALVAPEFVDARAPRYDESARATGVTTFTDIRSASAHLGIPLQTSLSLLDRLRQSL